MCCKLDAAAEFALIERLDVLGCRIDHVNEKSALEAIERFCEEDRPHLVVTADSSMIVQAQTDRELWGILQRADLVVPDSIGVVWAARQLGYDIRDRVTGVELVEKLAALCARRGLSIYLIGSAPGVAQRAGERLASKYTDLRVAGSHHGYFNEAEERDLLDHIRSSRPDVLLVAMGIPRQEKWLDSNLNTLPVCIGMGVGGSLDVMSGDVRRAPLFLQRLNLEWLYRVVTNPRRYRKALSLRSFVWLTLCEWGRRRIRNAAGGR